MKKLLVLLIVMATLLVSACDFGTSSRPSPQPTYQDNYPSRPSPATAGVPSADGKNVTFIDNLGTDTNQVTRTFNLPGDNIIYYWRVNVSFAPPRITERMLDTAMQGNIPRTVFIGAYLLKPGGSLPTNDQEWRYFTNYMYQGDILYYKLTSPTAQTVTLQVVDKKIVSAVPKAERTATTTGTPSADGSVTFNDNFDINASSLLRTFNLPGNNTVYYWRITVEFAPIGITERMLDTELQGNIPQDVFIGAYQMVPPNTSLPSNALEWRYFTNYMHRGDVLYYKLSSPSPRTVALKVVEKIKSGSPILVDPPRTPTITPTPTVTRTATPTTPTPTPAPTPTSAWVLKSTNTKIEKNADDAFDKYTATGTGASASFVRNWRSRTDARSGTITSSHTISPGAPPSRLVPGEKLEFNAQRTLNTGGEPNLYAWSGIGVWWGDSQGVIRRGPDGASGPTGALPSSQNSATNWATVFKWTVPGHQGDTMHVAFGHSGVSGSVTTWYVYEWKP